MTWEKSTVALVCSGAGHFVVALLHIFFSIPIEDKLFFFYLCSFLDISVKRLIVSLASLVFNSTSFVGHRPLIYYGIVLAWL